jgi:quinol monooxygenase YgiN
MSRRDRIVSTARITVQPQNRRELCLTISSLLDRIRGEQGCRTYQFYGEIKNKNSFMLVGEWETREAWDRHVDSDNFAVLAGSMRLLSSEPVIDFQILSHVTAVEEVTQARLGPERIANVHFLKSY